MADQNLIAAFESQATPVGIDPFDVNSITTGDPDPAAPPTTNPVAPPTAEPTTQVATPPADPVTAPPVADPAAPPAEPSFFDKLSGKKTDSATPPAPELPAEIKQKLAEYEAITTSDVFKLFNGQKDLRTVDLKELGKKLAGEDFSKLDDKTLFQRTLKSEYPAISDIDLEKAVESRVAKMAELEDWEQNLNRSRMVDILSKDVNPDQVFATLQEIQKRQAVDPAKQLEERIKTLSDMYSDLAKQAIGQEYLGYKMTEDDGRATLATFEDNVRSFTPEKNFLLLLKGATYEKAVEAAEKRGYEKAMIEKGKPDFGKTGAPVILPKDAQGLKAMTTQDFFNWQP